MPEVELKHVHGVLQFDRGHYQAFCTCGWSSSIDYYEAVDLLRAMHAHAVATFESYA
jgi:hypothetical protein